MKYETKSESEISMNQYRQLKHDFKLFREEINHFLKELPLQDKSDYSIYNKLNDILVEFNRLYNE
jgi:hypothetical protein